MLSRKATKFDEIFTIDLSLYVVNVKSMVKILSIFVAFLENMNFNASNHSVRDGRILELFTFSMAL